jgi:uncharacterized protein with HEPN domain
VHLVKLLVLIVLLAHLVNIVLVMYSEDLAVLQQIISSGRQVTNKVQNISKENFVHDKERYKEVADCIIRISRKTSSLSPSFRDRYESRVQWEAIVDMEKSKDSVWDIASYDVPFFTKRIEQISIDEQSQLLK